MGKPLLGQKFGKFYCSFFIIFFGVMLTFVNIRGVFYELLDFCWNCPALMHNFSHFFNFWQGLACLNIFKTIWDIIHNICYFLAKFLEFWICILWVTSFWVKIFFWCNYVWFICINYKLIMRVVILSTINSKVFFMVYEEVVKIILDVIMFWFDVVFL